MTDPLSSPSPHFTAEHEEFRASVRTFFRKEVVPYAAEWERRRAMPRSAWHAFAAEGLLGLNHPTSVGGAGLDFFHSVVFLEELGRTGFGGVRFAVALHAYMGTSYLATNGSPELRQRYLRPAVAGDLIAALAITEPQAGSDLARLEATAVEDGDHLVVDAEKRFIVNGGFADFFVTAVRTGERQLRVNQGNLSLLVVDRAAEGVHVLPNDSIAWRASGMADISMRGVRVPKENVIGRRNSGFVQIMKNMQLERLAAGISAVGDAANCLDTTWRYLKRRGMFESTLSAKQAVRHKMADLLTEVEAARQLAHHAAWSYARDPLSITACSMAKLKATEVARTVAEECRHLHGSEGFREGAPIVQTVHDAQAATVAAGASEVMRDIVVQSGYEELS
ncbi:MULTISPECIES: acyl-CoA dehydrogenase family protein [unclassified Streptomyces]|uniref:Acyl-CoA dehydrogenase family protein n=1 Tax=Streptomyces sp. NBC_00060 TaxID=2975636 RepID=A0AAU2GU99_9ACTN